MQRKSWLGVLIAAGLMFVFLGFMIVALRMDARAPGGDLGWRGGSSVVGVIHLTGLIADTRDIVEQMVKFRDDATVKAVVLRADSPGGAVGPSQEIYAELKKLDAAKPVVTSVGALCASGCYYAAVGTRRIFTNPGSLVGSIGVIIPLYEATGLFEWAKVRPQFIKSGKFKDVGHPSKPVSVDEAAMLQAVVDVTHNQFVEAIAAGRGFAGVMTDAVRQVADGRIFTGEQALAINFVDEMGTFRDAVAHAGKLGGIDGEPKIKYAKKEKKSLIELILEQGQSSLRESLFGSVRELPVTAGPGLYYLWNP